VPSGRENSLSPRAAPTQTLPDPRVCACATNPPSGKGSRPPAPGQRACLATRLRGSALLPLGFLRHWLAIEYIKTSFPAACPFRAAQRGVHTALFLVSFLWGSQRLQTPPGRASCPDEGWEHSVRAVGAGFSLRLGALRLSSAARIWPGPARERAEVALQSKLGAVGAGMRVGGDPCASTPDEAVAAVYNTVDVGYFTPTEAWYSTALHLLY
jgi:hypothetical protein